MEEIIKRLKEEELTAQELESLYFQYEDHGYVLLLIAKQKECAPDLSERCYLKVFSSDITGSYSPKDDKIIDLKDAHGNSLEFEHLMEFEFQDGLKEEAKALSSMDVAQVVAVKGLRVQGKTFFIESTDEAPEVIDDSAYAFRKKSSAKYFFQKAVMSTVLFAVIGGIGSKAMASDLKDVKQTTIVYELDTDEDRRIQAKMDRMAGDIADDLKFFADHFEFEKESQTLENISKLLKTKINSAEDLSKVDLKEKRKTMDKESRLDLELEIINLEKFYAKKITMKSFVQEKLQGLDDKLERLQSFDAEKGLSQDASSELQKIKNHKDIANLKKIAGENKDQQKWELVKKAYSALIGY